MKLWVQHIGGNRTPISLEEEPFASGGEGALYFIKSPESYQENTVAKVYHLKKRTELRYHKILYLHKHPPQNFTEEEDITLVWPEELLFDRNDRFVGFLMPRVHGKKLELLTLPKLPKKYQEEWYNFSFEEDKQLNKRLHIGFKIAKAIYHIHRTERYILVDMKPDNIMVTTDSEIALVDLDSVEIVENGKTIYDAPVATPEYSPPDSYKKNEIDPTQEDPWDRFGLAVILYKVLLGIHPFAATAGKPYDRFTSLYQKIENGLYVHNPEIRPYLKTIPTPHERFYSLPIPIQELFNRCFIEGVNDPFARPSSEEWTQALHEFHQNDLIKDEKIALPAIRLQKIPESIKPKEFYKIPVAEIISQEPKVRVEKAVTKEELKGHHLPKTIQDPKQINSQRFFNFIVLLLITVVAAALSLMMPWYITVAIGIIAYLGFNYATYRTRKSAERKDAIIGVMNNQMTYFEDLWSKARDYEKKIGTFIEKITELQQQTPQGNIEDIIFKKQLIQEKIEQFNLYIKRRRVDLRKIRREEKNEFNKLLEYYYNKMEESVHLPDLKAGTPLQKIILLKRAYRLGHLSDAERLRYQIDLNTLEEIQAQFEVEQADLELKYSERAKDIVFSIEEAHKQILEEIRVYHLSVEAKDEEQFQNFIDQQRISLSELERMQYDLKRLEQPLQEQVEACRRAKRDAELYKKINYGRHLLEMIGILRPL